MAEFKFARAADRSAFNAMIKNTTNSERAVRRLTTALSAHDVQGCSGIITHDEFHAFSYRVAKYQREYANPPMGKYEYGLFNYTDAVAADEMVYEQTRPSDSEAACSVAETAQPEKK